MRTASTIVACASLMFVAAASGADKPYGDLPPNCGVDSGTCAVTVIVPGACGSGIYAFPDPIVVAAGKSVDIEWQVKGDWDFDGNDAIKIYQASGTTFTAKQNGGKTFKLKHTNSKPATYKYDINLIGSKTKEKCRIDPTIVNW